MTISGSTGGTAAQAPADAVEAATEPQGTPENGTGENGDERDEQGRYLSGEAANHRCPPRDTETRSQPTGDLGIGRGAAAAGGTVRDPEIGLSARLKPARK